MKESQVAVGVRIELQKLGTTLFRNLVGRFRVVDDWGQERFIRTGLTVGSSDYIGFTEYLIKPEDVGKKMAIFTAVETKRSSGGRTSAEQKTFVERVILAGGIAFFASSSEAARGALTKWMRTTRDNLKL